MEKESYRHIFRGASRGLNHDNTILALLFTLVCFALCVSECNLLIPFTWGASSRWQIELNLPLSLLPPSALSTDRGINGEEWIPSWRCHGYAGFGPRRARATQGRGVILRLLLLVSLGRVLVNLRRSTVKMRPCEMRLGARENWYGSPTQPPTSFSGGVICLLRDWWWFPKDTFIKQDWARHIMKQRENMEGRGENIWLREFRHFRRNPLIKHLKIPNYASSY